MAEETPKTPAGGTGSEFPVFKFDGGFDRAKYDTQLKNMVENGQLTGKEIDEDLKEKKGSVDKVSSSAMKFYDESFNKNLKELDPGIDPKSIYYIESYSDGGSNRKRIKRKIEKGESVDGKEIFEMSKDSAKNKVLNMTALKKGSVTEIVQNLGFRNIKDFDSYDSVKSDFDSKVKGDNLKFDSFIDKFQDILSAFNDRGALSGQNAALLYTTENNAFISALAKILEDQGFDNESVTNSSKKYEENTDKLVAKEKSGGGEKTLESAKTENKGEVKLSNKTEELSESKESKENTKETPEGSKSIESAKSESTGGTKTQETSGATKLESTTGTVIENKISVDVSKGENTAAPSAGVGTSVNETTPSTSPGGSTPVAETTPTTIEDKKIESIENVTTEVKTGVPVENKSTGSVESSKLTETSKESKSNENKTANSKAENKGTTLGSATETKSNTEVANDTSSRQDSLFESLFGIKLGGKSSDSATMQSKKIESIFGVSSNTVSSKESKLENKGSNISKKAETSSTSSPIKETIKQNLASAIPNIPTETKVEDKSENTPQIKTETQTQTDELKNTDEKQETANKSIENEQNKKDNEETKLKSDEMQDNIKMMVTLLTQLNNTLQNPLIVIPNEKKFG